MRRIPVLLAALVGCLLLSLAMPNQAEGQRKHFTHAEAYENMFASVEAARLAGWCDKWRERLEHTREHVTLLSRNLDRSGINAQGREEYRTRLIEAQARPCPPDAAPPPAPVSPAPAAPAPTDPSAPLPRTVTLEDLRVELAVACGPSYEPARRRLVAGMDRAIRAEKDVAKRRALENQLADIWRRPVPPCEGYPTQASTAPPLPASKVALCENKYRDQVASGRGLTCRCAGQRPYLSVWGSNPYRGDSTICNAAVHAGVLPANSFGVVVLIPISGAQAALGTDRNGVSTSNWDYDFNDAFTLVARGE